MNAYLVDIFSMLILIKTNQFRLKKNAQYVMGMAINGIPQRTRRKIDMSDTDKEIGIIKSCLEALKDLESPEACKRVGDYLFDYCKCLGKKLREKQNETQ